MRQCLGPAFFIFHYSLFIIHLKGAAERLHLFHKEDTQLHKPNPDPLLECLRRMDLKPDQVLYVGDTPSDSKAAQAAGIDFAYATWNGVDYGSVDHAAHILEKPGDLLALFHAEH